jgi:hypothetical protein
MSVPLPSTFDCPQCHQVDQVQKISALIGGSTSPEQLDVVPDTSSSPLSQRLAPPQEPQYSGLLTPGELIATIVMAVIAFPAFGIAFEAFRETRSLMAEAANDPFAAPFASMWKIALFAGVVVLVLCLLGFAVTSQRYYQRQAAQRASQEEWSKARAKWDQLYYCSRCNGVFIPGGEPHLVAANNVPEFVYQ